MKRHAMLTVAVAGVLGLQTAWSGADESIGTVKEPAWLSGKPLNEWFAIQGTGGAGGAPVDDYSGMALKESSSEIIIAAAGGHGGSRDNRVVSIDLRADAPAWILRHAGSPVAPNDVSYNPDGQPASRHTYQSTHYVEALDRVMLVGCRYTRPRGGMFPTVDGFNLKSNIWDAAGTYPDVPQGGGFGVVKNSLTGDIWTDGRRKWNAASNTWSSPIKKGPGVRFPWAYDAKRNQLFGLTLGDGQGYDRHKGISAVRVPVNGSESFSVTINPGPALTQFTNDAPAYAGMDYDPDSDRFLFYAGQGSGAGRIYAITPNSSNAWEMSLYILGPGSSTPPASRGVHNRFHYVPQFKGFVLLPNGRDNLYFIRTRKARAAGPGS